MGVVLKQLLNIFIKKSAVSVGMLLLVATQLSAEVMSFQPVKDNTLYEDVDGGLSNGAGQYLFIGMTGGANGVNLRRALIQFDLSLLPVDTQINSVSLDVTISRSPKTTVSFDTAQIHRILSDWGESGSQAAGPEGGGIAAQVGDATWVYTFFDAGQWLEPGGDFVSMVSGSAQFTTADHETISFFSTQALIDDVQSWVSSPEMNFGWMIRGDEQSTANARRLNSRENLSSPPSLTIDFTLGGLTIFKDGFESE